MSSSILGDKFTIDNSTGEVVSQAIGNKATRASLTDGDTLERQTDGTLQIADTNATGTNGVDFDNLGKKVGWIKRGSLVASDAAGGIMSVQNTSGVDLGLVELWFDVTTGSTAACTVDVGAGSGASTSYDTLMDGFSVETGTAGENTHRLTLAGDQGTNGKTYTKWVNNEYITASMASGAAAGLVGTYVIWAIDLA